MFQWNLSTVKKCRMNCQQDHQQSWIVQLTAINTNNVAKVIMEASGNNFPRGFFRSGPTTLSTLESGCACVYTIPTHTPGNSLLFIAVLAPCSLFQRRPFPFQLRPVFFALINRHRSRFKSKHHLPRSGLPFYI